MSRRRRPSLPRWPSPPRRSPRKRRTSSGVRCKYCNRPLSDPVSIRRGYGPECAKKHHSRTHRVTTKTAYKLTPPPTYQRQNPMDIILKSVATGLLEAAILYSISTVAPPLGTILIPSYHALDYIKLGKTFYQLLEDIEQTGSSSDSREIDQSISEFSEPAADILSEPLANQMAHKLVNETAKKMGVNDNIYSTMLEGTISNGITNGVGSLAAYSVGTMLGV